MTTAGAEPTGSELRQGLRACLDVPRWVDEVMARAPFGSLLGLLDVAAAAANPLTSDEIEGAIAQQPRIGEPSTGTSPTASSAAMSPVDQPATVADDDEPARALAAGHAAYEQKFGRIFLVRTEGRSRPQILAELQRRLLLDPDEDLAVVGSELRDIALSRIPQLFDRLDRR